MDLFNKCKMFVRHEEVRDLGCYPYFCAISENNGPVVIMEGKEVIMAGTNNYLGLTDDMRVKEATRDALMKYGTGCSGSRLMNGSFTIHAELEEMLADFMDKEAALLFSTGFQTNQGAIVPMIGRKDYLLCDRENHSSIFQGAMVVKGIVGKDAIIKYRHNDMADLEKKLSRLPEDAGKLIVTDGVFSMLGDIVNMPVLVELAKKYKARVMIDDAHGLGVLCKGRGTAHSFGLNDNADIIMGTFSKSFASQGGFVAADRYVIDYIKHHSPAFIFSASMTPAQVTTVKKSLEIIKEEPERTQRLYEIQKKVRDELKHMGYDVPDGVTPIIPVIIGDDLTTFRIWQLLFDKGIYVNAVISPAVPKGQQLLRLSFMSTHEDGHIDYLLKVFEEIAEKCKNIRSDNYQYECRAM
ncbi:MAG: aminotransferase class I/II-fold pyridoxal phosphate-dependent enzyme [Spirochaetes bacterium]|nr:aminotransferase class I/II-fold pyridoxal phosphate-dependent enzyme [Spirochaetota bacterium]